MLADSQIKISMVWVCILLVSKYFIFKIKYPSSNYIIKACLSLKHSNFMIRKKVFTTYKSNILEFCVLLNAFLHFTMSLLKPCWGSLFIIPFSPFCATFLCTLPPPPPLFLFPLPRHHPIYLDFSMVIRNN